MTATAVILSGGASSRMGYPKALLDYKGETFADRLISAFSGYCQPVLLVVGADAALIEAGIRRGSEVRMVLNPEPEHGQFSSLRCALREVDEACDAVAFIPVDYPSIQRSTIAQLMDALHTDTKNNLFFIPRHEKKRGHPVVFRASLIPEFLALGRDAQARQIVHKYRDRTKYIDVDDPGITRDVDDREAYIRLVSGS